MGRAQTHAQAQAAPDLVLGLPLPDPADAFAHNQHTLKKRPHRYPVPASFSQKFS